MDDTITSVMKFLSNEILNKKANDSSTEILFLIPKLVNENIKNSLKLDTQSLLLTLAHFIKRYSACNISEFPVGAAGLCEDGDILLGVNMEFNGLPLFFCIHAEQFLISLSHKLKKNLKQIATTAMPCGHCRQFMKEILGEKELIINFGNETIKQGSLLLSNLLPHSFGPEDLLHNSFSSRLLSEYTHSHTISLFNEEQIKLKNPINTDLIESALQSVNRSYSPYSCCPSGISAILNNGKIFNGSYIESAAYNPSLSPIHSLLVSIWASGEYSKDIKEVLLLEKQFHKDNKKYISQKSVLQNIKKVSFPTASIIYMYID